MLFRDGARIRVRGCRRLRPIPLIHCPCPVRLLAAPRSDFVWLHSERTPQGCWEPKTEKNALPSNRPNHRETGPEGSGTGRDAHRRAQHVGVSEGNEPRTAQRGRKSRNDVRHPRIHGDDDIRPAEAMGNTVPIPAGIVHPDLVLAELPVHRGKVVVRIGAHDARSDADREAGLPLAGAARPSEYERKRRELTTTTHDDDAAAKGKALGGRAVTREEDDILTRLARRPDPPLTVRAPIAKRNGVHICTTPAPPMGLPMSKLPHGPRVPPPLQLLKWVFAPLPFIELDPGGWTGIVT